MIEIALNRVSHLFIENIVKLNMSLVDQVQPFIVTHEIFIECVRLAQLNDNLFDDRCTILEDEHNLTQMVLLCWMVEQEIETGFD